METREILSFSPDGRVGVVFTQRQLDNGEWHNQRARNATPEELATKTVKKEEPPVEPEVKSGSHNTHARLAPSGSKQWANCTSSLAYIEANAHRVPEDKGSVWAQEGTDAHDEAADVLMGNKAVLDVPEKFRDPVRDYCTHCMEVTPEGVKPMVEVVVPLFYQKDATGTCDFAVVTDDRVIVRDYKHGAGVLVTSEGNTQLAIYCMSLIRDLEDVYAFHPGTEIDMAVYQPRHREGLDQNPWHLSLADLEAFCAEIAARAEEAQQGVAIVEGVLWDGPVTCDRIEEVAPMTRFAPSEGDGGACRWCAAKAFCERRLTEMTKDIPIGDPLEMISSMPDLDKEQKKAPPRERLVQRTPDYEGLEVLDDKFLVAAYAAAKNLTAWLGDVEEYLHNRLIDGERVGGVKLVMGREGNRAWGNEEEAETFLKGQKLKIEDRCKIALKTPTQIQKILKEKLEKSVRTRNRFEELITRSPAKKVLALESDKRQAVDAPVDVMPEESAADDFEI